MDSKDFLLSDFSFEAQTSKNSSLFTKRDIVRILFKHKGMILSLFVLTTLIVVAVLVYLPAFYKVDTRILIKTDQIGTPTFFSGIASVREPMLPNPAERQIANEVELVAARSILSEVVDELNLNYDQIALKPYQYFLNPLIDWYDLLMLKYLDKKIDPEKRGRSKTIEQLQKAIEVESVAGNGAEVNSNIVQVSLLSTSEDLATTVLNKLLEYYTAHDFRINQDAGEKAYEVVKLRHDEAKNNVQQAENDLKNFLANKGVTRHATIKAGSGSSMNIQGMNNPSPGLPGKERVITTPRDESIINVLKAQLVETKIQLMEYQAKYPASSTEVSSRVKLIKEINEQLAAEIGKSAENESQLITLERELKTAEGKFLELEKRLSEISLFLDVNKFQMKNRIIIETPVRPLESEWKKSLGIGALTSLGSLLLGILFAAFREYTEKSYRTDTEVQQDLGIEVVASFPKTNKIPTVLRCKEQLPPNLALHTSKLQRLASQLLFVLSKNKNENEEGLACGSSVYVTSCDSNEGKTLFSVLLARELAPLCQKGVLLVDANFDRPFLHERLAIEVKKPGFTDLLQETITNNSATIDLSAQPTGLPNLFFLGAGTKPSTGLLYRQDSINKITQFLNKKFDIVLYDGGGLSGCGANALLRTAEQTIIMFDSENTRRAVARKLIRSSGIKKEDPGIWVIMNKVIQHIPRSLYRKL